MYFGQVGYAMGFPNVWEKGEPLTSHIAEMDDWPVPMLTMLLVNMTLSTDVVYCASYINDGYSGGAVVFPVPGTDNDWNVAGIITHFPTVLRGVFSAAGNEIGKVQQHTGLLGYRPWKIIEHLIETAA